MSKQKPVFNTPDAEDIPPPYQETDATSSNYEPSAPSASNVVYQSPPFNPNYQPPTPDGPTSPTLYPRIPPNFIQHQQPYYPQSPPFPQQYPQSPPFPQQYPQSQPYPQPQPYFPQPQPYHTQPQQQSRYQTIQIPYVVSAPRREVAQRRGFPLAAIFFLFGCFCPILWIIGACCCAGSRNEYEAFWGKLNFIMAMVLIVTSIIYSFFAMSQFIT